jgi:AcrR family transcriptional regulator
MTETLRIRRTPTQARSRQTVQRILDAADAIVGESGVDAATTRAIAERAGVAAPSLYRFFADRDEVLDAVLERSLRDLDAHAEAADRAWTGTTIEDFMRLEIELHVAYYQEHPSFVRLWFGGRASKPVVEEVHARNRGLARRGHEALIGAGLVDRATPEVIFDLLVELGDRILELAFREDDTADREVVEAGIVALTAFAERSARPTA